MKILAPLIFLAGVFSMFLLSNCGPDDPSCPDNSEEFRSISEWAEDRIPYNGTDTLRFLTNTSDTVVYIGEGRAYETELEMQHLGEPVCNSYHKIKYEAYSIRFASINDSISLKHTARLAPQGGLMINSSHADFDVYINAVSNSNSTYYPFFDSIKINDQIFYQVSKITNGKDSLFLNKDYGILLIKSFNQNKTLTLIR